MYKIFLNYSFDEEPVRFLVSSSDSYIDMNYRFESLCNFFTTHYCDLKILSTISVESSYSFKDDNFVIVDPSCVRRFVFKDGSSFVVSLENAD